MTWPTTAPAATVQRVADAQAHLALERCGPAAIAAWQTQRLAELVQWLLNQVPWWRERLGSQVNLGAWQALPILSRLDLRKGVAIHGAAPVPAHHGGVTPYLLAGPPGSIARFYTSAFNQRMIEHAFYADHQRQGRNAYAPLACITDDIPLHEGQHIDVEPSIEAGIGPQWLRQDGIFTQREHVKWLQTVRPAYLATTPHSLESLLNRAHKMKAKLPEIRQVLTYGEQVSTALRAKARKQLGASVRHRYTCLECGPLAFQCPRSDDYFHVAVGNVMLEVVDDKGAPMVPSEGPSEEPGKTESHSTAGRVLVTALHQYATPMIRHDTGDTAALHAQCPGCGLEVPSLSQLQQNA